MENDHSRTAWLASGSQEGVPKKRLAVVFANLSFSEMLLRCQNGFEKWLAAELADFGCPAVETGAGWAKAPDGKLDVATLERLCFPHATLLEPVEVSGESVNAMAEKIVGFFFETARTERFDGPWPLLVETAGGQDGLGRRADSVMKAVAEVLKKRMSRVAKLASLEQPWGVGERRGLFIFFADFSRAFVSRAAVFGGQRRMADDPLAPSRSYLKVEEAYGVLGREPAEGETVADLGAAPGGWSYSAAKRGARVVAVDNGPLKGGALNHPLIEHRREDAFRFAPAQDEVFDWMFCDLVEEPHHVMRNLIEPWVARRWCRRFVAILKFGRVDPVALLRDLRASQSVFEQRATGVRLRHLFHDREELTIVGDVGP